MSFASILDDYCTATGRANREIAEECGYASIYAFSHFFKNTLSISPNHFRNQNAGPGQ